MLILQVGCKARKQDCYEHFIGPQGRNKEMKLFYCFMKWDNKDIDWTTNILPTGVGSSSCAVPKVDLSGEDFEPGDNVRVHYRINICASFFFSHCHFSGGRHGRNCTVHTTLWYATFHTFLILQFVFGTSFPPPDVTHLCHIPLTKYHSPYTTHHIPLTIYHSPCTTHNIPLTIYHSPHATHVTHL